MSPLLALMAVALVAIGMLFLREARLRRAEQQLLLRVLFHWTTSYEEPATPDILQVASGEIARRRLQRRHG